MINLLKILSRSALWLLLFLFLFSCSTVQKDDYKNFQKFSGLGFEIMLPNGFNYEKHQPLKNAVASYPFFGPERADSFIRIDIYDAKKVRQLERIVEQNEKFFEITGDKKETELDEIKAIYFDYNASETVGGRVYFLLHSGQMYRIILNWYKPQQNKFLPLFEKTINSITFNL